MRQVLFSPSTNRVIFDDFIGVSKTVKLFYDEDGLLSGETIHAAPLSLHDMSMAFSNFDITDWTCLEVRSLEDVAHHMEAVR